MSGLADRYCVCGHLYSVHHDFTVFADTACTVDDPEGRWACWCDEFKKPTTAAEYTRQLQEKAVIE